MLQNLPEKGWRLISNLHHPFCRIGRPKGRIIGRLAFVTVAGLFGLTTMATILHTRASMANYPGGAALAQLNDGFANVQHGMSLPTSTQPLFLTCLLYHSTRTHRKPRRSVRCLVVSPNSRPAILPDSFKLQSGDGLDI